MLLRLALWVVATGCAGCTSQGDERERKYVRKPLKELTQMERLRLEAEKQGNAKVQDELGQL